MPSYLTPAYVRSLSDSDDTSLDTLYQDVIDGLQRRIDRKVGQYFASGYTGNYNVRRQEVKEYGTLLAVPRCKTITAVEFRRYVGSDWETLDSDEYETALVLDMCWDGLDTVQLATPRAGQFRITGEVGWQTGESVPSELKTEAAKQARMERSRLAIGGTTGTGIYSGDMTVEVDGWLYLMSLQQTMKSLTDWRRF